jgi:MFS family permease
MNALAEVKALRRNYILFQTAFTSLLWLPVFYEFQKRVGLSEREIFSIQSFYYLFFCLVELPTGWLADRFSRAGCLVAGAVAVVLSNFSPILAVGRPDWAFGLMGLHFALVAIARSLVSGAGSALLFDSLAARGAVSEYRAIEARAKTFGLAGKLILWPLAGWWMERALPAPYYLTALATVLALPSGIRLLQASSQETKRASNTEWKGALRWALSDRRFMGSVLLGIPGFILARIVIVNLFQPLLQQRGIPVATFGFVLSGMTLLEVVGTEVRWGRRSSDDPASEVFFFSMALAGCVALFPWLKAGRALLVGLALFSALMGRVFPAQRQQIQEVLPATSSRALLLSVESILDRAASAGCAAWLAARWSLGEAVVLPELGWICFAFLAGGWLLLRGFALTRPMVALKK